MFDGTSPPPAFSRVEAISGLSTLFVCLASLAASPSNGSDGKSWPEGKSYNLRGLKVTLSARCWCAEARVFIGSLR